MRNMTARANARELGLKTYETGIPCKKGHIAPRATLTGTCCACTTEATIAWLKRHEGKAAAYTAAYRDRNRGEVLEKDRAAKARQRKEHPEKYRAINTRNYRNKIMREEGREVLPFNLVPVSELVSRLHKEHQGKLQYVEGYKSMLSNATFLCTVHDTLVEAAPHNVLRGANPCTKCNHTKSNAEEAIGDFLETFTTVVRRDRCQIKPKELDIYLPEHKLAIEFCGMYWHSSLSPSTKKRDNQKKHIEKHQQCAEKGIRLITIYESEWETRQAQIKRLLRNAIGATHGKLMARKCEVVYPSPAEAREFFEEYHPQGGTGNGDHYGLRYKGKLVACMRFTLGGNDRGVGAKTRTWTLSRYATRINVVGGASRLFKQFIAAKDPSSVKSFSDNRYFSGGMYAMLGFNLEEEVIEDYQVWSSKLGLRPKSHYQRRMLQDRLTDHGFSEKYDHTTDTRTETEMTEFMGCGRIYDCGKKRWVWSRQ